MHLTEYIAWVPMLVLIVVLGFFPNLIFNITDPKRRERCLAQSPWVGS